MVLAKHWQNHNISFRQSFAVKSDYVQEKSEGIFNKKIRRHFSRKYNTDSHKYKWWVILKQGGNILTHWSYCVSADVYILNIILCLYCKHHLLSNAIHLWMQYCIKLKIHNICIHPSLIFSVYTLCITQYTQYIFILCPHLSGRFLHYQYF